MTDLAAPVRAKLAKALRLLSSNRDGEVLSAAHTIIRVLRGAGADIHALADQFEHANGKLNEAEMQKLYDAGYDAGLRAAEHKQHGDGDFSNVDGLPDWHKMARWCQTHDLSDRLREKEREFVDDICARTVWREPSVRQQAWLKSIFFKLGGRI